MIKKLQFKLYIARSANFILKTYNYYFTHKN